MVLVLFLSQANIVGSGTPSRPRKSDRQDRERGTFADRSFANTLSAGSGRWEHLMVERFGPVAFGFALVREGERLRLVLRRWTCLSLPLPLVLAPSNDSYEHVG
jgi:hypothetical protein